MSVLFGHYGLLWSVHVVMAEACLVSSEDVQIELHIPGHVVLHACLFAAVAHQARLNATSMYVTTTWIFVQYRPTNS